MRPKIILLDWDGTLCDGYPVTSRAINATRIERGEPPLNEQEMRACWSDPMHILFPDENDQARFIAHWDRIYETIPPAPTPGAEELLTYLQKLRAEGIYVGIVTNKPCKLIGQDCIQLGWNGYFDVVVGRDNALTKPNPAAMAKALENYKGASIKNPREILYIGDADKDLQFARNTGVRFMGVGSDINEPSYLCEQCGDIAQVHKRITHLMNRIDRQIEH